MRSRRPSQTGSYTDPTLAAEEEEPSSPDGGAGEPTETPPVPAPPARPRLRRRPLGYRRGDVDDALAARDSELAELRQDVAALWLAFAQHDRILRTITEGSAPRTAAGAEPEPGSVAGAGQAEVPPVAGEAASIGTQLSELEEVLAAIESATQTLERTYSEELAATGQTESPAGDEPPGEPTEDAERPD